MPVTPVARGFPVLQTSLTHPAVDITRWLVYATGSWAKLAPGLPGVLTTQIKVAVCKLSVVKCLTRGLCQTMNISRIPNIFRYSKGKLLEENVKNPLTTSGLIF